MVDRTPDHRPDGFGHQPRIGVVLLAGGSGRRIGLEENKVYIRFDDRQMLTFSMDAIAGVESVVQRVLVARPEDDGAARMTIRRHGTDWRLVHGGDTRHASEYAGLSALRPDITEGAIDVIAIHDGARPFATVDLLEEVCSVADRQGGAIPGVPATTTLYQRSPNGIRALPEDALRIVQTPQAFRAGPLLAAYDRAAAVGFQGVDTAETVERFSDLSVAVVEGDVRNIKVTFGDDLDMARDLARVWHAGRWQDS